MGQALRSAPAGHPAAFSYERRRPEETTLYQVVQEQFETSSPSSKRKPVRACRSLSKTNSRPISNAAYWRTAFCACAVLDAHEKLVAFSCKRRGFCPSCGARRMAQSAAYLVDEVIPRVPVRQWVLSFPIPLRSLLAVHPELLAPVLRIIHRVIARDRKSVV